MDRQTQRGKMMQENKENKVGGVVHQKPTGVEMTVGEYEQIAEISKKLWAEC